ncbi:reverse transcriptase domain-containing protein [Tanacetum coccineum]
MANSDNEPMWAADRIVAPTPGPTITIPATANELEIKGNHFTLVKGNQFDGRIKTDPHKHIHEFIGVCDMFKYGATKNEAYRLMIFPLSLTSKAKTWLDKLNEGTIAFWDELQTASISRFFPPTLFNRLLEEIRGFSQHQHKTLTDAWLRMKELLINSHGHGLTKGNIIKIFYYGLNEIAQKALNAATRGIFLYKTPNQAYQLLEDKVLLKFNSPKNQKPKAFVRKTVAFADESSSNSDTDKIMARMDVITMKMDAEYKEMKSRTECNHYGETFMDLKTKLETTTKNHQASIQNLEEKFDRLADKESARPSGSLPSNTQPNPRGNSSKPFQPPPARNEHVNAIYTRSDRSYDPPTNPNNSQNQNDSQNPIDFNSDDEDEEPTPQPQTPKPNKEALTPNLYKPRIPYHQLL